jgi:acetyl esterase
LHSSPFWELPQPKPQEVLTGLQNKYPVDMSGVTTVEKTITRWSHSEALHHEAAGSEETPGVLLFIPGAVWIAGNFQNHQRLLRDLVVGSGQIGVFPEITNLPEGKFPVALEESYATLKWIAAHASELGADGTRPLRSREILSVET